MLLNVIDIAGTALNGATLAILVFGVSRPEVRRLHHFQMLALIAVGQVVLSFGHLVDTATAEQKHTGAIVAMFALATAANSSALKRATH